MALSTLMLLSTESTNQYFRTTLMSNHNKNNKSQRQLTWEWIKTHPNFTKKQLTNDVNITSSAANSLIKFLIDHKRLKQKTKRRGCIGAKYKLINTDYIQFGSGSRKGCRNTKGKRNTAKQRCWTTMRVLHAFTIGDVAAGAEVALCTAGTYIRKLTQANFVRCIQGVDKVNDKNSVARFRLIHNSGPLYPIVCDDSIYDQNLDKRHEYQATVSAKSINKNAKEKSYEHQKLA